MIFAQECSFLTEERIPKAWKKATEAEKMAELLLYHLVSNCLETFSHVSVELQSDHPVAKVIQSWKERTPEFGTYAIYLSNSNDSCTLGCKYDIYALNEDLQLIASDLFGTLNPEDVSEDYLFSGLEIPDEKMQPLLSAIQKKIGVKSN